MTRLAACEEIIDASGIGPRIEALLPAGVRPRQLRVRTLLAGMCLTQADGRPAPLPRVHPALTSPPAHERRRARGLEARPAPAYLPAGRVPLQPGHRRSRQARTRRAALAGAASGLR